MDEEQLQNKLQKGVTDMLEKLERDSLRAIQAKTHEKIAKCYKDNNKSSREVEQCASNCTVPLQSIQQNVQHHMGDFQQSLSRCSDKCQSDLQYQYDLQNLSDRARGEVEVKMRSCVSSCVDEHLNRLKTIEKRIKETVAAATRDL